MHWDRLLSPDIVWVLIPISFAIAWTITETLKLVHRHQERKAMIEQGMHPDLQRSAAPEKDGWKCK
jgi:hypothetical protein